MHAFWAPDAKGITPMITMMTQRGCPGAQTKILDPELSSMNPVPWRGCPDATPPPVLASYLHRKPYTHAALSSILDPIPHDHHDQLGVWTFTLDLVSQGQNLASTVSLCSASLTSGP